MKIVKAPSAIPVDAPRPFVFLAGSIEMGFAEDWQEAIESALSSVTGTILNPRRDDWDASWRQDKDEPQFREQVEWELDALESSDLIALYLSPGTKSPISLLELGLFCSRNMVVCCPTGFWRKGNVDIVCERKGILVTETIADFVAALKRQLADISDESV